MEAYDLLRSALAAFRAANIPACVVGEVALNYYNVPRVVHICVPAAGLAKAVSALRLTGRFRLESRQREYDIFIEYKRGFPTFYQLGRPTDAQIDVAIVVFPDTFFHLSPIRRNIVSHEKNVSCATYSRQIEDFVPADEVKNLPVPHLAPYFVGLCLRFFEANDAMARIAAELLGDGMRLDEEWVQVNLGDAPNDVLHLATRLVDERSSASDDSLETEVLELIGNHGRAVNPQQIPGSGYQ